MSDELDHSEGEFTAEDDAKLLKLVKDAQEKAGYAFAGWKEIANAMGKAPRKCRERHNLYLTDDVDGRPWTAAEDELLREKVADLGCYWPRISRFFPDRSENSLKNR